MPYIETKCICCKWIWTRNSLQPLLVAKLRDECAAISIVDAGLLPGRPDGADGFVHGGGALEVRCVGGKLAHETHQAFDLFGSDLWILRQ